MITFVRNVFGGVLTVIDLAVRSEAMGRAYAANAAQSSWLDRQEEASEVLEPRSFVCNTRAVEPTNKDPEWVRDMIDATVAYAEGAGLMSAEQARAFIENDAPPCEHHSCAREGYGLCLGVAGAQMDWMEDSRRSKCDECEDDPADSLLRYNDIECDTCATEHADFPGAPIACATEGCPNSSHPSAPGIPHRSAADRPEPIARADARGSGHQTSPDVAAGSQQRANVVGGVASAGDLLPGGGAGQPPLCLAKDPTAGYLCTADKGHGGAHEASDGAEIVTRWSNGSGHPLDREAHEALLEAALELDSKADFEVMAHRVTRLRALAAEIRDLAHQFEADAQAEGA